MIGKRYIGPRPIRHLIYIRKGHFQSCLISLVFQSKCANEKNGHLFPSHGIIRREGRCRSALRNSRFHQCSCVASVPGILRNILKLRCRLRLFGKLQGQDENFGKGRTGYGLFRPESPILIPADDSRFDQPQNFGLRIGTLQIAKGFIGAYLSRCSHT
ncbi:Uncharacterised protein [Mycobacterium tuberculosis]|nr:Uncharacterised protein [Mycobacterium tuberculosis]